MRRLSFAILLTALNTLMLELLLTRLFDVILTPNLAYMVITCAMFAFGLAGIYTVVRQPSAGTIDRRLSILALLFGVSTLALLPVLNALPFDFQRINEAPVVQGLSFLGMYLALILPFFFSGLIFANTFSVFADQIQSLYFWDLTGAALGCLVLVPILPEVGPAGLMFFIGASCLVCSALLSGHRVRRFLAVAAAIGTVAVPLTHYPSYIEFKLHREKRGVERDIKAGRREFTRWDPISKIDIIDQPDHDRKHIAYDGGSQSSNFFHFDGRLAHLREHLFDDITSQFWQRGVFASHYLKEGSGPEVLVIGSAGGQETKAALLFGARHVDAVELVATVVDLGRTRYAAYTGEIFHDPRVDVRVGEGRSFLRASRKKYDIIQMFSNHTSSSIAAGTGAMATAYLQTTDAYKEYFSRLADDGVLHINHHIFPRMIATAAAAWKELGRTDFRRHVLVFARRDWVDNLPTLLIKMRPWSPEEVNRLSELFAIPGNDSPHGFTMVENPLDPASSFLSEDFYSGSLPADLVERMPYRVYPPTDDRPFFSFLRKKARILEEDPTLFVDRSTAGYLNAPLATGGIPLDVIHLFVTAAVSLFYAAVFILVPLYFSPVGRTPWSGKAPTLIYFACLGSGFIIFELVLIQIFMKLVGYPLYTYSVVIFTMLLAAGIGSRSSKRLVGTSGDRWPVPFAGVLGTGVVLMSVHPWVFHVFLETGTAARILAAVVMIFPLGFFLGMPFPLGILELQHKPRGAIAWAWGLNGLFTVIGGLISVILGLFVGFRAALLVALLLYALAFGVFWTLRTGRPPLPGS